MRRGRKETRQVNYKSPFFSFLTWVTRVVTLFRPFPRVRALHCHGNFDSFSFTVPFCFLWRGGGGNVMSLRIPGRGKERKISINPDRKRIRILSLWWDEEENSGHCKYLFGVRTSLHFLASESFEMFHSLYCVQYYVLNNIANDMWGFSMPFGEVVKEGVGGSQFAGCFGVVCLYRKTKLLLLVPLPKSKLHTQRGWTRGTDAHLFIRIAPPPPPPLSKSSFCSKLQQ